jgi:hypothetical protein
METNSSCADVASRGSLELGSECFNRGQMIFMRFSTRRCRSVSLCGLPLQGLPLVWPTTSGPTTCVAYHFRAYHLCGLPLQGLPLVWPTTLCGLPLCVAYHFRAYHFVWPTTSGPTTLCGLPLCVAYHFVASRCFHFTITALTVDRGRSRREEV